MAAIGQRRWTRALFLAVALVHGSPASASAPGAEDPGARFERGAQQWAVAVGHGLGLDLFGSAGSDLEDVEFAALVPRWGIALSDPLGGDAWYRGSPELLAEGAFLYAYEPKGGFAWGGTVLLRWNFLTSGRVVPFVELGAGIVDLEFDLDQQADGINFTPQGGAGLHYRVSPRVAITGEWRLHHISNADLRRDNDGINDSLFLVGLTFFPE